LRSYVSETIQAASEGRFGDDRTLKVSSNITYHDGETKYSGKLLEVERLKQMKWGI
jgi:hypothetical protein